MFITSFLAAAVGSFVVELCLPDRLNEVKVVSLLRENSVSDDDIFNLLRIIHSPTFKRGDFQEALRKINPDLADRYPVWRFDRQVHLSVNRRWFWQDVDYDPVDVKKP